LIEPLDKAMLITLTTDFGTSDHFVGAMKGVILTIAPRVTIVDITHGITPFDINEAAFTISQAWRWFPKGAIHVVVVDPGVGTARRPILVEAGGHRFIGPDNGVLTMIFEEFARARVRAIENPKLMLKDVSRTFHGRDVFAPVAAHLARGVAAARVGKLIHDAVRSVGLAPVSTKKNSWIGRVLKVDRFGNLITNFRADILSEPFELQVGSEVIRRLVQNYAECAEGEVAAILGSSGFVEISVNQGSAAERLGCAAGAEIELGR
jgi:S-adenosylmethionine hydrolase